MTAPDATVEVTPEPCPLCGDPMHVNIDRIEHVVQGKCLIGSLSFPIERLTAWNTRQQAERDTIAGGGEEVWERLKAVCCADPAKATKCVMVGKDQLLAALATPAGVEEVVGKLAHENGPVIIDWMGEGLAWRPLDYGTWTPISAALSTSPDTTGDGR